MGGGYWESSLSPLGDVSYVVEAISLNYLDPIMNMKSLNIMERLDWYSKKWGVIEAF